MHMNLRHCATWPFAVAAVAAVIGQSPTANVARERERERQRIVGGAVATPSLALAT